MSIQQHPIPQDVTNYKFRLVGDMTLKQFLQLAVGIVLAVVTWGSPLPFFFKYPLAIIFAAVGLGMAFVPIEGRPLDQWLLAFIKSIYSPTIYTWKKSEEKLEVTPTITVPPKPISQPPPPPTPQNTQSSILNTKSLPIPFTPTTPNTFVGLVLTPDNHILEGAMIEITQNNLTARATKSNKLGQFLFAKPLDNGTYFIHTTKDGFQFDTYALTLTGEIIKPLKIQAKKI